MRGEETDGVNERDRLVGRDRMRWRKLCEVEKAE